MFKLLFSRFWLKLISLGLAVLVWVFVESKEMLEVSSTMNVRLVSTSDHAIHGASGYTKDITLRGPRGVAGKITDDPLEATIYLPPQLGMRRLRLERQHLDNKIDSRLALTIHEPYISVNTEEKISKTVPIKVMLQGSPHEGYYVERIHTRPSNVTLSGPRTYISNLKHVTTETWDISGLRTYMSKQIRLSLPTDVETMFSVDSTRVSLTIEREKINQRFSEIPINVLGTPYTTTTIPKHVSITLQGHVSTLIQIKKAGLSAFVQIEDTHLRPGVYELAIQVQIPQNTTLVETIPEFATVTIHPQPRP